MHAKPKPNISRELVLPTGMAHIVLRLDDSPVRILENPNDQQGICYAGSVIGGVRETTYCKEMEPLTPAVGMLLRPGALELLSGAPATQFSGTHTSLNSVWGDSSVAQILEILRCAGTLSQKLDALEIFLRRCLPQVQCAHVAVTHALSRFASGARVADVVLETGLSHRHFIKLFTTSVGLSPKRFQRIQRLNHAVSINKKFPTLSWAEIAAASGYADQAHLIRELRRIVGVLPSKYRQLSQHSTHHLPLSQG